MEVKCIDNKSLDGYLTNAKGSKKFGIALSVKDKNHLEKLNKCLSSNYPIKTYQQKHGFSNNTQYCRLLITSDKIFDDLEIISNK